jgi:hypothetical protein
LASKRRIDGLLSQALNNRAKNMPRPSGGWTGSVYMVKHGDRTGKGSKLFQKTGFFPQHKKNTIFEAPFSSGPGKRKRN